MPSVPVGHVEKAIVEELPNDEAQFVAAWMSWSPPNKDQPAAFYVEPDDMHRGFFMVSFRTLIPMTKVRLTNLKREGRMAWSILRCAAIYHREGVLPGPPTQPTSPADLERPLILE